MANSSNSTFTIIDIETTGLSKYHDKITEIAAVRIQNGQIVEEIQKLVFQDLLQNLPESITRWLKMHQTSNRYSQASSIS